MQEYIKYLKNVLGVSQVLKPNESSAPARALATGPSTSPQVSTHKITVWVENYHQFSPDDHTLLNNMLAATKIPAADIKVEDLSLKGSTHSPIEFDLVQMPATSQSQTYSPQVMHANKSLKAIAWTFLQQVMQQYKNL